MNRFLFYDSNADVGNLISELSSHGTADDWKY